MASENTVTISEYQLFECIISQGLILKNKTPNYSTCEHEFKIQNKMKGNESFSKFFKTSWTRFFRFKGNQNYKNQGNIYILNQASHVPVYMEKLYN